MPATRSRARAVFIGLTVLFSAIIFRLYDLQIAGHESYRRDRANQSRGWSDQRRPRGTIFDARGDALAISVPVSSIAAAPSKIARAEDAAAALAPLLGIDKAELVKLLTRTRNGPDGQARLSEFVWLRRRVPAEASAAVKKLALPGVFIQPEYDRAYPQGKLLAHVLGLTDIDDRGGDGLEKRLEGSLAGERSREEIDVDGRRRTLSWPEGPSGVN